MTAARSPGEAGEGRPPPTVIGETFTLKIRLTDDEIRSFARQLHDLNPLHHDLAAARAAGYPGLIASGAHTGAVFMGMTATHFSAPTPDGAARSVLGLGFDIRFRAVVLADDDLALRWTVASSVWKDSLAGYVTRCDGAVHCARGLVLSGTANLLLRHG